MDKHIEGYWECSCNECEQQKYEEFMSDIQAEENAMIEDYLNR